jgi:MFS family permease
MERNKYEHNIIKEYIFAGFFNLDLTRGLWMIYLAMRGFTLIQLGILESTFHVTSFLMEIPTGAVADLWSRKASRILGRISYLISLLLLFLSHSFIFQLIGFVFCAIGYNLESGAGEALLYDSLNEESKKNRYMKIAGTREFLVQASSIIALLVGGYAATKGYNLVFILSLTVVILSLVTAFTFTETQLPVNKKKLEIHPVKQLIKQTSESFKILRDKKQIAFYILFSELIFSFTVSLFFYLQNFWKNNGYTEFHIGVIFAAASLLSGLTSLFAQKIEKKLGGERGLVLVLPMVLLFSLWGIALSPWKFPFYLFIGFLEGLLFIAISDYINKLIPPENRATVLSFQSMVFSFFMIAIFPLIGWLGETRNLETAFLLMALFGTLIGAVYYTNFLRGKRSIG